MSFKKSVVVLSVLVGVVSSLSAVQTYSAVVYSKTCSICHGASGEGNPEIPDAPVLTGMSQEELATKLSEIKGVGFEKYHEKMEKNLKIIELRGMKYDSLEMANYIFTNFNKETK